MGNDAEDDSAPKPAMEKPLSTPDMSARETEDMVCSMLRDSPLPDTDRGDERLQEDGGSDKLLEEDDGEKLPDGGDKKLPEGTPTGKLVKPLYLEKYFSLLLS